MSKIDIEEARLRAAAAFAAAKKAEDDIWHERMRLRDDLNEKTRRLKALRLAKEAAERIAAAAPAKKGKAPRKVVSSKPGRA
jgi:hypothetical protein